MRGDNVAGISLVLFRDSDNRLATSVGATALMSIK
jgi:hypothetical protein